MKKTALVTGGGPTGEKSPQGLDLQRKRRGKKNFSGPGKRFLSQSAGKALRQSLPGLPAGAVLLPVGTIDEDTAAEVIPEKDSTVLVYCRSGNRSKTASSKLADLGYTNIYEFGGINTWPYETES